MITCPTGAAEGAAGDAAGTVAAWLGFAAMPSFAAMALLTGLPGGGPTDSLCAAGHGAPLDGMVPMYLLMAAFHASPWLKLLSGRTRKQPPR